MQTGNLSALKTDRRRTVWATRLQLLAAMPYVFFVPFSAHVTKVTGMTECDDLGEIDYVSPKKCVTNIFYVLRGHLPYL